MTLKTLISPLLKWWWLLVISTAIAGGMSYYITRPMPPIYSARTTLIVGQAINDPNPSGNAWAMARQLAEAYASIAMQEPLQEATRVALGIDKLPEFSATTVPNSPFLEIAVTDIDPQRAQAVANEIAHQLILESPNAGNQDPSRQEFINNQLTSLQVEISKTTDEINVKQQELASLTSAVQIANSQADIAALQTKLNLFQQNYVNLLANSGQGAQNTLTIFDSADIPTSPIGPNKKLMILAAAFAGFALASGVAYLVEFWDRTVSTEEDVQRLFGVPVIGYIGNLNNKTENPFKFMSEHPRSPNADSFRTLRANLEFMSIDSPLRSLLITSAVQGDGKTTIATNLAICISQVEKKVVLLDGDLRHPNIHKSLGIPSQPGLSDAIRQKLEPMEIVNTINIDHLNIITSGSIPPNPAELLSSQSMTSMIEKIKEDSDILIVDAPPYLITDAAVLATKVDGVLLVFRPGLLREDVAKKINSQLQRSGARVIGVVFNRVTGSGYTYENYSYYHTDDNKRSWIPNIVSKKRKKPKTAEKPQLEKQSQPVEE